MMKTQANNKKINELENITFKLDYRNNRLKATDKGKVTKDEANSIISISKQNGLDKIIVECRESNVEVFEAAGFSRRGVMKGFFKGIDAYCLTYFTDKNRSMSSNWELEEDILSKVMQKPADYQPSEPEYQIREASVDDIPQMIDLFKAVFTTYPSPVFDESYLKKSMGSNIMFKAAFDQNKLVSIASADMDFKNLNAEITDCATYPAYRGKGLLSSLIEALETDLRKRGFITVYSLSRSLNTGINMVLRKHGYQYSGRLINNCDICGKYEDMNIWVKTL